MRMKGFIIKRPHSIEYSFENLGIMLRSHCWVKEIEQKTTPKTQALDERLSK